jgi:molybdate transport system permease protein
VALPLSLPGYVAAAILTFAHTVGEFGVVMMLGGNIPGETTVLSTEIYRLVEGLEWGQAHRLSLLLLAFAFAVLLVLLAIERRAGVLERRG